MLLLTSAQIAEPGHDDRAFLHLFADCYYSLIASDPSGAIQQRMSAEQLLLLAFVTFDSQVSSGGFLQLIENGYGAYIFDNPLPHQLRLWGAYASADIIDEARPHYCLKKDLLEKPKTLEEFAKLYQQHPEFEPLEQRYEASIPADRWAIRGYIQAHLSHFDRLH